MKSIIYISILFVGILFSSCNDGFNLHNENDGNSLENELDLTPEECLSIAYDSDNELTEVQAGDILSKFISEITKSNTRSSDISFRLAKETVIKGEANTRSVKADDQITFYQYDIESDLSNPGFAVVCADKRFPSVIAFSEKGHTQEENVAMMLNNSQYLSIAYISRIRSLEDSLRSKTLAKISDAIDSHVTEDVIDSILNRAKLSTRGSAVTPDGTLLAQIGPLTTTKWDQTSPYNFKIKSTVGTGDVDAFGYDYNNRYPAGCTVIAMAQLAAFYKPSTGISGFNWSTASVPSFERNDTTLAAALQVANLVSTIATGTATEFDSRGGSTYMSNAVSFMKKWGINIDSKSKSLTYANIKSNLDALKPVVVTGVSRDSTYTRATRSTSGGGHAWLIDGYSITRTKVNGSFLYKYYCNCNFGWGGNSNGWYLFATNGSISFTTKPYLSHIDLENMIIYYGCKIYDSSLECYLTSKN